LLLFGKLRPLTTKFEPAKRGNMKILVNMTGINRFAVLTVLVFSGSACAADCTPTTPGVEAMTSTAVTIEISTESSKSFDMLIADENLERSAGFQDICPDVISRTLILFIFPNEFIPSFHMRNVHAPLDIAFLDATGLVVDIQTMDTYVLGARNNPLYSPSTRSKAALEADVGFFEQQGVEVDVSRIIFPGSSPGSSAR
jgi:uncharacterized membrane protein (UPF0127 family)